jgi:shikimate dehydrogenase
MKKAFVIGHPITHSRSPLIHGEWLKANAIAGSYEAFDVAPEALSSFVARLRAGEFVGGNVTVPHKEAVFALCDRVDDQARKIGAVNTLVLDGGKVRGFNTDYLGFLGNLDQNAPGWDRGLTSAIVLGAGGASRAILLALIERGVKTIHLLNRTVSKAQSLAAEFGSSVVPGPLSAFNTLAPNTALVVNASSIGMHETRFEGIDLARLPKSALVTDIVYVPLVTPLLAEARASGLRVLDGLGMLLHQAVPGFEAWFGVRPVVTPDLRRLVEATL